MALHIIHHPGYAATMPEGHRFPMGKFRALADRLCADGLVSPTGFICPEEASTEQLTVAHTAAYVAAINSQSLSSAAERRLGLPLTESVARRARLATGGTIHAARAALETGAAFNTAGGSHHARGDGGAGFCVFNDVAVAAKLLVQEGNIDRALVIDLDVHHGDGTALMCADDPAIFTVSVHCANNWPLVKPPSDLDVALPAGTGNDVYLAELRTLLPKAFAASRPDIVFYNAGVDPHKDDRLGRMALDDSGIAERDSTVLTACRAHGVPVVGVLGGGYSTDVEALAGRHSLMFHAAAQLF